MVPRCINRYQQHIAGGDPVTDQHPIQGGRGGIVIFPVAFMLQISEVLPWYPVRFAKFNAYQIRIGHRNMCILGLANGFDSVEKLFGRP